MKMFLIENIQAPWGDYGDVFWTGITEWNSKDNLFEMYRTGPFSPDIYRENNGLVLTQKALEEYNSSGLSGLSDIFPLIKKRIVKVNWQEWDVKTSISAYLDDIYEPEAILFEGKDDPILNEKMPNYFIAQIESKVNVFIDRNKTLPQEMYIITKILDTSSDFFIGVEFRGYFVSEKAMLWLNSFFPNHFNFYEVKINLH